METDEVFKDIQKSRTKVSPAITGGAWFSTGAFSTGISSVWETFGFCSFGGEDVDLTLEELLERRSPDTDLDFDLALFSTEADFDLDLLLFFGGDLDLVLPGRGECDLDRPRRDTERELERLTDLTGERFFLTGVRERLLAGDRDVDRLRAGELRLRGVLDLERRLRLRITIDLDRVRLALRPDRDRERRDLGGGDLLRRLWDTLLERLPLARLEPDRDLDRLERRVLVGERDLERDRERLLAAPLRLGERVLERLIPPRERDPDLLRLFRGDQEGDLRLLCFGDLDDFLLGEDLFLFGETDRGLFHLLGDLDFLRGFDTFFLGVGEREVERER